MKMRRFENVHILLMMKLYKNNWKLLNIWVNSMQTLEIMDVDSKWNVCYKIDWSLIDSNINDFDKYWNNIFYKWEILNNREFFKNTNGDYNYKSKDVL